MSEMDNKVQAYKNEIGELESTLPDVAQAYHAFTGACFADGALDAKTKQLIALGIGLFANNEVCTLYHVNEARHKGAGDAEIMEAVAVAAAIGGGHALSQGVMRVQKALSGNGAHLS
ncbi:carboxymuconolactone decarboxylase family protein [Paenibacillus thiaminolyticus]|uniref:carboxymuconolactone decarboxylase family protein n=1 Tax=Paenibacillus thiaminolyticus TaxID=49283 RepID=UPI00232EEB62|nr:carboxymuconolactone decarboxylase family protein [Paenibacillus thiaminolyticus]WCF11264.1 carboxymuconolactone decarboxylase family protein [Paenibacillus thiaminolyticus]